MRNPIFITTLIALTSCSNHMSFENPDQMKRDAKASAVEKGTANGHFLQVGTTPDGRPLMMTQVDLGYSTDRVYVVGETVVAKESCGKACEKTIVSVAPAAKTH